MTTMNISLPDSLREFVEAQLEEGDYASVSEYVRSLIRQAKQEQELDERLLLALESEDAGELDAEFFNALRERLRT